MLMTLKIESFTQSISQRNSDSLITLVCSVRKYNSQQLRESLHTSHRRRLCCRCQLKSMLALVGKVGEEDIAHMA